MNATLFFRIPQADINVYEAATIAQVLSTKPITRAGEYQFRYEIEPDDLEWSEDKVAADSAAWKFWEESIRVDLEQHFDSEMVALIEECISINVTPDSNEDETAEHSRNYQRAAFNW